MHPFLIGCLLQKMIFHPTIPPPYFACIFTSTREQKDDGYNELARTLDALAKDQEGYLGIDSARDPSNGEGITVSYWRTMDSMLNWKQQVEHVNAQKLGRDQFYLDYHIHIAEIQREYSMKSSATKFLKGRDTPN